MMLYVWHLTSVCRLSVWRLSVAYIGPKSRTERPRKTKIGTAVAHVTRDSGTLSRSKGQRSRSPGRFTQRGLYASGSCSGGCGNVFTVGLQARRREALRCPQRDERGGGISWRPPAYSLFLKSWSRSQKWRVLVLVTVLLLFLADKWQILWLIMKTMNTVMKNAPRETQTLRAAYPGVVHPPSL